jgi:hypothetical protein
MTTYREQLEHPMWQRKRLELLSERSFQCECCHSAEKQLHVHHKRYEKNKEVWEYENDDLLCLCKDCHKIRHNLERKIAEIASNLSYGWLLRLAGYAGSFSGELEVPDYITIGPSLYRWGVADRSVSPPEGTGLRPCATENK